MKKSLISVVLCLIALTFLAGCNATDEAELVALRQKVAELEDLTAPPPASLDNFYPPKADQPIFLYQMLGMGQHAFGMMSDIMQNDMENAMVNFEKFKGSYKQTSEMVPEWKEWFKMEPLDAFETALKSGDPGQIMPAFENMAHVCHECHVAHMANVKFRYQWYDFKDFQIPDPFAEDDIQIARLMQYLAMGMDGMINDLEQGQNEHAIRNFQMFNTSFQALKGTCGLCHETNRTYFVDEGIQSMIDKVGQLVAEPVVDVEKVTQMTNAIGMESCYKCHLVHVPAALTHDRWRTMGSVAEH